MLTENKLGQILTTAGFIVEGMQTSYPLIDVFTEVDGGAITCITTATSYAPYIEKLGDVGYDFLNSHRMGSNGVFYYDVSSAFGEWFAEQVMSDDEPDRQACKTWIRETVLKFMLENNDPTAEQKADLENQLNLIE